VRWTVFGQLLDTIFDLSLLRKILFSLSSDFAVLKEIGGGVELTMTFSVDGVELMVVLVLFPFSHEACSTSLLRQRLMAMVLWYCY